MASDLSVGTDASALDGGGAPSDLAGDLGVVCRDAFAGCTSFVDDRDGGALRTVTFQDYFYSPKCIQMKAGETVRFIGDFSVHPLREACGPAGVFQNDTGFEKRFTPTVPGVYGIYCLDHGSIDGQSMAGAIRVIQ